MRTNLPVDQSVQDHQVDERDDGVDEEVEVDEVILHVERIQPEGGSFYFQLCVKFRISIG